LNAVLDPAWRRTFKFTQARALEFRKQTFNPFNHTSFLGPEAVNGDIDGRLFGRVVQTATPRLVLVR
jgi:hypothetical protein